MGTMLQYLDTLDQRWCVSMNRWSLQEPIRRFFAIISRLGDGGFWVITGLWIVAGMGSAGLGHAVRMLAAAMLGILIYRVLKQNLVRERPYITNDKIVRGTAPLDRYSFPSGHTLHAVSFSIQFLALAPELALVIIPFAFLVAVSRMVLGLHYPTDVLVGALLGGVLGFASIQFIN